MLSIPSAAKPILMSLSIAFTQPTFQRMVPLAIGAILTVGRRTITHLLWTMRGLVAGHPSTYHRVFSRAVWPLWPLGRVLASLILRPIPPDQPVLVPMDDTTAQHRGKCVYGKGCHHDAVRSSHNHIVFRWGHRWVVLAISVKFPFISRWWALPVLAALYRPEELNRIKSFCICFATQKLLILYNAFLCALLRPGSDLLPAETSRGQEPCLCVALPGPAVAQNTLDDVADQDAL